MTPGIREPDRSTTHWIVPPWPIGATFSEVVSHFELHAPQYPDKVAHMRAYRLGYEAALKDAPIDTILPLGADWYEVMRTCVSRCADHYRAMPERSSRSAGGAGSGSRR